MPDLGVPTFTPSTADAAAGLVRGAYQAFARGDVGAVLALFADDILWHVPGRGPLSRDYHGRAEVLGFFRQLAQLSGGTLQIEIEDILAKGDTVVVLCKESARRGDRSWTSLQVHVWTVHAGKITRFWQYQGDQQSEDEFWVAPVWAPSDRGPGAQALSADWRFD